MTLPRRANPEALRHGGVRKGIAGKMFTIDQVLDLLAQNKIPQNISMDTAYGYRFEFYIEAQVWNYDILNNYMDRRDV